MLLREMVNLGCLLGVFTVYTVITLNHYAQTIAMAHSSALCFESSVVSDFTQLKRKYPIKNMPCKRQPPEVLSLPLWSSVGNSSQ
jgi:hypothetical protein